jgi:hypothetical protein
LAYDGSMKRLVLHIGSPKAGSTSLQRFLAENRKRLGAAGISCPELPGEAAGTPARLKEAFQSDDESARAVLDAVGSAIAAAPGDVVVLSSEGIASIDDSHRPAARIARLAAETWNVQLDVVAFIRPQHLFLNSSYAQHVRTLVTSDRFQPFVRRMINDRRFDNARVYGSWATVFGRRFHAIPFTARELAGSLETRFFGDIGLGDRLAAIDGLAPSPTANPSPGPVALEVHRRVAAAGGRARFGPRFRQARSHLHRVGVTAGWDRDRFSGLTDPIVETIRSAFRQRNEAFAMHHWARSWDSVFAADYDRQFVSNEYDPAKAGPELEAEVAAAVADVLDRYAAPDSLSGRLGRLLRRIAR